MSRRAASSGGLTSADVALKADKATTITAGAGLTGGGSLASNRTIDVGASDATITVAADGISVTTPVTAANVAAALGSLALNTTTTDSFTQPAIGSTVSIPVTSSAWMFVGQRVYVAGGGLYDVTAIADSTHFTGRNMGDAGSAAAAATVSTSALVADAGRVKIRGYARTDASESTTSNTYVDLATAGPTVSMYTGASVLIRGTAFWYTSSGSNSIYIAYDISNATTVAASDSTAFQYGVGQGTANRIMPSSGMHMITGLTPGLNTFKLKYRTDGASTMTWFYRALEVSEP